MDKIEQLAIIDRLDTIINVDKSSSLETTIVKGEPKVITMNVDEEWIENSLIDLPFIYYYQYQSKEPVQMISYKWKSNDGLDREIQVRSSIKGIPTPFEYDVLLALIRIYLRNNDNRIIINDKTPNKSNMIKFTFRELSKEMGFKGFGSKTKKRLQNSIEKLCDTNIYSTSKGGIYDPVKKEYITNSTQGIGIIKNFNSYSYINTLEGVVLDKQSLKDKASVVIDDFFFNNIKAGKGKISNGSLRKSLKVDVARRLYLIINKWRNGRNSMFITYKKLYERIPLDGTKTVSYRNNRIKSACKELISIGFLNNCDFSKEGVIFMFKQKYSSDTTPEESSSDTTPLIQKYKTYTEIYEGFINYNFTNKEIDKYLGFDKIPLAQAILRYVDCHLANIENPKNYIIGSLINNDKSILNNDKYSEVAMTKDE